MNVETAKKYNSWESRYNRLKDNRLNNQARNFYNKMLTSTYSAMTLSESEEAIVFSQAFQRGLLKNPDAAEFGKFDEYEIKTFGSCYIFRCYYCRNNHDALILWLI